MRLRNGADGPWGELSAQPETVYHDLATAIIEGRLLSMNAALPEIDRLLDQESDQSAARSWKWTRYTPRTSANRWWIGSVNRSVFMELQAGD
ncbi:MAG: hypothetical protein IPL99_29770 [Candidatus Competibacteraceae bacterium]|nr:hypothetical protein [Candidatus Competibacteraceae bacterium]